MLLILALEQVKSHLYGLHLLKWSESLLQRKTATQRAKKATVMTIEMDKNKDKGMESNVF